MKKSINQLALFITIVFLVGCRNDQDLELKLVHTKEFNTDRINGVFINRNGTAYLRVVGSYEDTDPNSNVIERGFVYGFNTDPEVGDSNTVPALGEPESVVGHLDWLERNRNFRIRGYFKMNDGSFFYGNEIGANTFFDLSGTRSLELEMNSLPFWRSTTEITAELKVVKLNSESPVDIGFEYSVNANFSDSKLALIDLNINRNFQTGSSYRKELSGLIPNTKYYFRPYAKYADGAITTGGITTAELSTL
ncbi:hypothetical protein [Tenacibaculum sp. 190524A02b]|uniref:Fibronectin type-III domain-containing protein n=1 Tax=Tenacibaculum vairaonense TaxID=3137860 RepID=A0ABP1F6U2_9FLAO